jgi:hypothetical protein
MWNGRKLMDLMEVTQLLGNVGEFVGAVAVVVTLVYLAIQVRHSRAATEANTRQLRANAFVDLSAALREYYRWLRDNPEKADSILRSAQDWGSLSKEDSRTAMWWFNDEAGYYELAFMLWQEGVMDEETYKSREEYFISVLLAPGTRQWWETYAYMLDRRFVDRVNGQLEQAADLGTEELSKRFPMYGAAQ